jgi:hypothetical protein
VILACLASLLFPLTGCTNDTPDELPPDPAALAESLTTTLQRKDEVGFKANFAGSTIGQRIADEWYTNLAQFQDVSFVAQTDSTNLSVTWSVPGSAAAAQNVITTELVRVGDRTLLFDLPDSDNPPVWLFGPVTVLSSDAGSLIYSERVSESQAKAWQKRLATAVKLVKKAKLGAVADDWNGQLVVEIPRDTREYQLLVGLDPAVSSAGTECKGSVVRIVVNPASLGVPDPEAEQLMVHEATHVAVSSPCLSNGALWASEGLSEWVVATTYEESEEHNKSAIQAHLLRNGMPATLPTDSDFTGDRDSVTAAYALSELVVSAAVEKMGRDEAIQTIGKAAHDRGALDAPTLRKLTEWYQAELEKLSGE